MHEVLMIIYGIFILYNIMTGHIKLGCDNEKVTWLGRQETAPAVDSYKACQFGTSNPAPGGLDPSGYRVCRH